MYNFRVIIIIIYPRALIKITASRQFANASVHLKNLLDASLFIKVRQPCLISKWRVEMKIPHRKVGSCVLVCSASLGATDNMQRFIYLFVHTHIRINSATENVFFFYKPLNK
jgi:hypothetical protein